MIATKPYALDSRTYQKTYLDINADNRRKFLFWIFAAVIVVIGLSIYAHQKNGGGFEVLKSWFPFFGMLFVVYWYLYWRFPISFFRDKLNRSSFSRRVYRFYEDRLDIESEDGSVSSVPYKAYTKHKISSDYFAFWESSLVAQIIPSEAFESKEDFNRAADHIKKALE